MPHDIDAASREEGNMKAVNVILVLKSLATKASIFSFLSFVLLSFSVSSFANGSVLTSSLRYNDVQSLSQQSIKTTVVPAPQQLSTLKTQLISPPSHQTLDIEVGTTWLLAVGVVALVLVRRRLIMAERSAKAAS